MSPGGRMCSWPAAAGASQSSCIAICVPLRKAAGISAPAGYMTRNRWASIETTQIIPVDLNSLLYGLEEDHSRWL